MLDQILGAAQQGQSQKGSGFSLDQLLTGPGGMATGAAAGGLAGLLLSGGKPKKLAKNALKAGGVALVGGLAYKAYRDWQNKQGAGAPTQAPTAAPDQDAFIPQIAAERDSLARLLSRAMITAAKADGHVTAAERARISEQLGQLELSAADQAFIRNQLDAAMDIEPLIKEADTPERAAEIYAASLLAVDPDGGAERGYLAMLAARLQLPEGLVAHLHAEAQGAADPLAA